MSEQMNKYDRQIAHLQSMDEEEFRRRVNSQWGCGIGLFQFCFRGGERPDGVGCLTMVKGGAYIAQTEDLTNRIKADKRIPSMESGITKDNLFVLKEWQEEMDRLLGPGIKQFNPYEKAEKGVEA